ncbi:hypothetical protein DVH05_002951 [Phytophthora capsici]|nr:hypothetical protein DVH05_002951 [Phytophthora capsici]
MPTPPSSARTHFKTTDRSCNKSNKFHQCRHCLAAARLAQRVGARSLLVEDIRARKENFEAHLEDCRHAPIWAKPSSHEFRPYSRHDEERECSSSSSGDQSQIPDFSQCFNPDVTDELERLLVEFQADNRLPDTFISLPSTRNLFAFLMALSVASSPSRQVLGGRILDIRRTQFLTEAKDVWMDIARIHLRGCHISRHGDRELARFGLESVRQRSEGNRSPLLTRESEEIATAFAMSRVEVAEELAPSSPVKEVAATPVVNDQAVQPETQRLPTSLPMSMTSSYQAESRRVAMASDQLEGQRLAVKQQELQLKQSELRVKEQELQLKQSELRVKEQELQSELRAKQEENRQKLRAEVLTKLVEAGKSPTEVREYLAIMDPVDSRPV